MGRTSKCTAPSGHPHPLAPPFQLPVRGSILPFSSLSKCLLNTYYVLGLCSVLRIQQQQVPELLGLYLRARER